MGTVRVLRRGDLPPTVPFWLGEAPARSAELSEAVSRPAAVSPAAYYSGDGEAARLVMEQSGVSTEVAQQVVADRCRRARRARGLLSTPDRIMVERCFDESEGFS